MRRLPILLLLSIVAGCASTTAPIVIREIAPPEIDTANVRTVALLPFPPGEENEPLAKILSEEIIKVIEGTARYEMKVIPADVKAGSPAEMVEAAEGVDADILIGARVVSASSARAESTLEVEYSFYSAESGEKFLSKTGRVSGGEAGDAARRIAKSIASSLMPHEVERTLLLEYSQNRHTSVGVELARKGIWDEAERKWWVAARTRNDPAAYHNLGVALERRRLYGLAKTAYENAFARNPKSPLYREDIDRIQSIIGTRR